MKIRIHPHAAQRIRERGATVAQVRETVAHGRRSAAKFGRTKFRRVFAFAKRWNGKHYAKQQIEAFAAIIPDGWLVVTVVVKYF
jgi:hypothetical protein